MNAWWGRVVLGLLVGLLLVAVLAGATAFVDEPAPTSTPPEPPITDTQPGIEGELKPSPSPSPRPRSGDEDAGQWWILVVLGVAGAAAAVYLWRRRPQPDPVEPDDGVDDILAAAIEQVGQGRVGDAVIGCWRDLEGLAAQRGLHRGAAEPAHDFAQRAAHALRLPAERLALLGDLFERAWYSSGGSTSADAAQARSCLEALIAAARAGR